MTLQSANTFLSLVSAFRALPDDEANQLVEDNSGELYLFAEYWKQANGPAQIAFDASDAAYIFLSLYELNKKDRRYGLPLLWEVAGVSAGALIELVDFSGEYDYGVFAYEHAADVGAYVFAHWTRTGTVQAVREYATSQGWPLLTLPEACGPVDSVQVSATRDYGQDIHLVSKDCPEATHYSVYLRRVKGSPTHVESFAILGAFSHSRVDALTKALAKAAMLSAEHNVPVEPIK